MEVDAECTQCGESIGYEVCVVFGALDDRGEPVVGAVLHEIICLDDWEHDRTRFTSQTRRAGLRRMN